MQFVDGRSLAAVIRDLRSGVAAAPAFGGLVAIEDGTADAEPHPRRRPVHAGSDRSGGR